MVVDGIDGSGKNTAAQIIKEWYEERGVRTKIMAHPSARKCGKVARKALQSQGPLMRVIASVFYIIDVLMSVSQLKKMKDQDIAVIFVRYLMGTAYLPERFMGLGYDVFAKVLPISEAMVLIDVRPEIALKRIQSRPDVKEMFEDLGNLEKARRKVLKLSEKGWRVLDNSNGNGELAIELSSILEDWESRSVTTFPR
ncbi:MAG: thymidylate kinase [Methanomassiliicoccales archaeon]|nr:MAG: thymidylate kinase [Methanomassiliicoccales archaeon]